MTRIAKFFALTGALTTLTFGAVAIAGPHGGGGPESVVLQVIKELDLTEAQRTKLKELRESNRETYDMAREQREETMNIFKAELASDNPDGKKLHRLIDAREKHMIRRMHDKLDTVLILHSILTTSQRAELADKMTEVRERHEGMRRERGERRRGEGRQR